MDSDESLKKIDVIVILHARSVSRFDGAMEISAAVLNQNLTVQHPRNACVLNIRRVRALPGRICMLAGADGGMGSWSFQIEEENPPSEWVHTSPHWLSTDKPGRPGF